MRVSTPSRGPSCKWCRTVFSAFLFLFFSASLTRAQDVAEAARQERARKAAQQEAPRHVYTEADLRHEKILTPEDQAKTEARKSQPADPSVERTAESNSPGSTKQTESLGEIARRYRQQKSERAAEQAAKKNLTPFSYNLPAPVLAAPKPERAPKRLAPPVIDSRINTTPNLAPNPYRSPVAPRKPQRISPFQPRPLVVAPHALREFPDLHKSPALRSSPAKPLVSPGIDRRTPVNRLPVPRPAGLRPLRVQRGESWWKLAERYLGTGARWPELRSLNPGTNGPPESLLLGSTILVPQETNTRAHSPARIIIVKKGDSLWLLAREHLGHASRWTSLARANPQISDYTRLAIGTRLQLPPP